MIVLFRFSIFSWLSLRRYMFLEIYPLFKAVQFFWHISIPSFDHLYFGDVSFNFSFSSEFIYLGLFSLLLNLTKGFFYFAYLFTNQILVPLICFSVFYFFLYFIYFQSKLYYFFPSTDIKLYLFFSFLFKYKDKLLIWGVLYFICFLK